MDPYHNPNSQHNLNPNNNNFAYQPPLNYGIPPPVGGVPPMMPPPGGAPPFLPFRPPYPYPGMPPAMVPSVPGIPPPIRPAIPFVPPPQTISSGILPAPNFIKEGENEDNLPTLTLFIGGINKGVEDTTIEKVLNCFGNLKNWKRPRDPSTNQPKTFGFAEFKDPMAVLLLNRFTEPDNVDFSLKLPSELEGVEPKGLKVTYEDDVTKALAKFKRDKDIGDLDFDMIESTKEKLLALLPTLPGYKKSDQEENNNNNNKRDSNFNDKAHSNKRNHPNELNNDSSSDSDFSEEERVLTRFKEQANQKLKERDLDYNDALKRWEEREHYKGASYERYRIREIESEEKRELTRSEHFKSFKEWDDDKELELGREDYYKDRAKWWEKRKAIRARELESDAIDRVKEAKEADRLLYLKEKEKERLIELEKEKERQAKLTSPSDSNATPAKDTPNSKLEENKLSGKVKLSMKQPLTHLQLKRVTNTNNNSSSLGSPAASTPNQINPVLLANQEEDDLYVLPSQRTKRALVKLEYSDEENDKKREKDSSRKRNKEKSKKIRAEDLQVKEELKKLMEIIPAGKQELFDWKVKWDFFDKSALNKLASFIQRKIHSYLGTDEPELSNFILKQLHDRQPPEALLKELEKVLDEDGVTFTLQIWRMLIFETEARFKMLI